MSRGRKLEVVQTEKKVAQRRGKRLEAARPAAGGAAAVKTTCTSI